MAAETHVVSKKDSTQHATISVDTTALPPLAPDSVRTRTKLISITRNNMSYADHGHLWHWWDTYPVPGSSGSLAIPAPYDDTEQWGIVPAWGYGEVLESTKPEIPKGTTLWGYWPTSSVPVDLKLSGPKPAGHFWEVSEHRTRLMQLYNHYEVVDELPPKEAQGWFVGAITGLASGFIMDRYSFPAVRGDSTTSTPLVHPSGTDAKWTAADADLSSTVIVSLCASSKTAQGFAWNWRHREAGSGPLGLVEATTSPEKLPAALPASFETKRVTYDGLSDAYEWIGNLKPKRVIVVDFGAPAGVAQRFHDELLSSPSGSGAESFLYLCVGAAPDAVQVEDPRVTKIMFNMSPVKYRGADAESLEVFASSQKNAFQQWYEEKAMGDTELDWRRGVAGEAGIHGAWEGLCTGDFPRNKALLYQLP